MPLNAAVRNVFVGAKHRLPLRLRADRLYWQTIRSIRDQEGWTLDRIVAAQVEALRKMLQHCAKNVPYYRRRFRELGFDPCSIHYPEDIRVLPLLSKGQVMEHTDDFLAENIPSSQRLFYTTGGTTGKPLALYGPLATGWRERAFMDAQWARVGYQPYYRKAVLKGIVVISQDHWRYDPDENAYRFSVYHLTKEEAGRYAEIMKRKQIRFLHCYISSALEFARQLQEAGVDPPSLDAVFAASENIYPGQREQLESFFRCRLYTWYGHSENLVMAGECEVSHSYHIFPSYGFVELIGDDQQPVKSQGEMGELVGTSLYNEVMPLVRYRTADYGIVGPAQCTCNRPYGLLSGVRGRWAQEMLVGRLGNRITNTSLNMHSDIFNNVVQYQFHQSEMGKAELWLVRKPVYCEADSRKILDGFNQKMGDSIDLTLRFVDAIELSSRGKFRWIVQKLPITEEIDLEKHRGGEPF